MLRLSYNLVTFEYVRKNEKNYWLANNMNVREMQEPTTGWLLAEDTQAPLSLTYILYF